MDKLDNILHKIIHFRDEREWAQFHTPKNLSAALCIEAAELQELMLWKTDAQVAEELATSEGKAQSAAEIADILIFALLFCNQARIDPLEAITTKLQENAQKYPVELAKGNATKYSQLKPTTRS